jgi:hypothetical protein
MVAIDAVAAKMMGFDPLSIKFIRLAHEAGLGCGDVREIDIVGEDISSVNFHFNGFSDTFASRGQKLIYWGPLKPLEKFLLRTAIAGPTPRRFFIMTSTGILVSRPSKRPGERVRQLFSRY